MAPAERPTRGSIHHASRATRSCRRSLPPRSANSITLGAECDEDTVRKYTSASVQQEVIVTELSARRLMERLIAPPQVRRKHKVHVILVPFQVDLSGEHD